MCVNEVQVFEEDVQIVFVKSGFISVGLCPSLDEYERALNIVSAWRTEECAVGEQRFYAAREFRAEKNH